MIEFPFFAALVACLLVHAFDVIDVPGWVCALLLVGSCWQCAGNRMIDEFAPQRGRDDTGGGFGVVTRRLR